MDGKHQHLQFIVVLFYITIVSNNVSQCDCVKIVYKTNCTDSLQNSMATSIREAHVKKGMMML